MYVCNSPLEFHYVGYNSGMEQESQRPRMPLGVSLLNLV